MSKTTKIILKLSICVFLNILLKTVILNYSTIWLLTPTLSKKLYYSMSVLCLYLCVCMSQAYAPISEPDLQNSHNFLLFLNTRCHCSVFLWPHCNTSCTSIFVDDVMFLRNDRVTKTPSLCHSIRYTCVCPSVCHKPVCIEMTKRLKLVWKLCYSVL